MSRDYLGGVRNTDPSTSRNAAEALTEARLSHLQHLVVGALSQYGPCTTSELSDRLNIPRDTLSPRFPKLRALGAVEDSGVRRVPLGLNRAQIVWKLGGSSNDEPRRAARPLNEAQSEVLKAVIANGGWNTADNWIWTDILTTERIFGQLVRLGYVVRAPNYGPFQLTDQGRAWGLLNATQQDI